MTLSQVIILLLTGIGAGFSAGLLGVGGGFLMTPMQFIVYTQAGIPQDIAIRMAFGTGLLVILPIAASSAWRHNKHGAVKWRTATIMGACGAVASFGGAMLSTHLPGNALKIAFGAMMLAAAVRLLAVKLSESENSPQTSPWIWAVWAIPVGLVNGLLGLGGGIIAVPVMLLIFRFRMHISVATSSAMMIFASIGGIIGYIIGGAGVSGLPSGSLGYINLPVWGLLAVSSVGMAQVGAATAHRLPAKQLQYIFAAVLVYFGLRMLGVFNLGG